jgi:hypothetical protein
MDVGKRHGALQHLISAYNAVAIVAGNHHPTETTSGDAIVAACRCVFEKHA